MTVFINGKQKRVKRPPTIDGLPVEEFIRRNADALWYHQNEEWENIPLYGEDDFGLGLDFFDADEDGDECAADIPWESWHAYHDPEDEDPEDDDPDWEPALAEWHGIPWEYLYGKRERVGWFRLQREWRRAFQERSLAEDEWMSCEPDLATGY